MAVLVDERSGDGRRADRGGGDGGRADTGAGEWPPAGADCPWFGSDLGAWLTGTRRTLDGAEAAWLAGLAAFDREGGWMADGFLTCAAWLMARMGMARATAFERLRVAHELDRRPVLGAALADGRASYCAVRTMVRAEGASPGVDEALVAVAGAGSVADVEQAVRVYRLHADQDRRPEDRAAPRGLRIRSLGEGMVRLEAVLTDVEGAELEAVLRAMLSRHLPSVDESARADAADGTDVADGTDLADGTDSAPGAAGTATPPEPCNWPELRADALMVAARAALGSAPAPGADRYTVHVVVDHERGCLLGGAPLAREEWQRIACDCATVVHHHDPDGRPLALGRRRRTWSVAQRRAVTVRDDGRCRWPGCANTHVDVHHLLPWEEGGTTDTANGILLCPGHHTRIHQGFSAHGTADGVLEFTRRDGTPLGLSTPGAAVAGLPLAA